MCERGEIENLFAEYTYLLDDGDFDGLGQMFRRGRVRVLQGPRGGAHGEGVDGVPAMYRSLVVVEPSGSPRTHHLNTNFLIRIDGDTATATSFFCVMQQSDDFPLQPVSGGIYRDILRKDAEGWYFEEREITCDQVGDLSRHTPGIAPPSR
jgi:SnoaL-like domain